MKKLFLGCVGLVALLGIVGGMSSNPSAKPAPKVTTGQKATHSERCVVTLEKFYNMKDGMSYHQIERDVGCPARVLSSSAIAGYKTVMVSWDGRGSFGANMNATFQNGSLVGKAQFGLE